MKILWECAPWGMAVESAAVTTAMVVEEEMEEEISTSFWGLYCGIAPCLQTGASSSFSTWTWRSFWPKMEWAACITTTALVQPRSPHRAHSQLYPTRAPSAYHPHLHLAPHLHHLLHHLHHHSSAWRWLSRRTLQEVQTVFMGVRRVWTTPASHPAPPLRLPVHLCWRPQAVGLMELECLTWIPLICLTPLASRTLTPGDIHLVKRSSSHSQWSRRLARSWCQITWRMKSIGPGGIKTTRQQSVPGMLAVLRRTKSQCALPTWREKMPPYDRKWLRSVKNSAAVATSLANTRTALLTSDDGMKENNQEEEELKLDLIKDFALWKWHDGQNGVKKMLIMVILMMNVQDRRRFVFWSSGVMFCWGVSS